MQDHNPFRFGSPVSGEFFLERAGEREALSRFLLNGVSVVLIGPRRFGKTSFVLDLLAHLEQEHQRPTLLVDIFSITSHRDFLQQLLNAIRKKRTVLQHLGAWVKSLPKKLNPSFRVETNDIAFSLHLSQLSETEEKQLIIDLLEQLHRLLPNGCVAFDEFQKVASLDDGGWLEATLRTVMQAHREVSFLFTGSRRSIIHEMFNNQSRPFYRSCQMVDFPAFGPEFTHWVQQRFGRAGLFASLDDIDYLRAQVSDTPNYVQMAGYHLVAANQPATPRRDITRRDIDTVMETIVRQNAYAYQTLLNSLSPLQQRVLRMAARQKSSVFSQENLEKYEIRTAGHVAQAIKALKSKQLLDEDTRKGRVLFDDPLFALWLNLTFEG